MIEEKGSISKVQRNTGIYRFQVEGYSGLSARVGDSIESPEFTLCGYIWQLRIFPGGSLDSHKGHLSYYLASKSNKVARASYKLSVVNQIMGGEDECFCSSGARIFEAKGVQVDGWGRDKFMLNALFKDSTLGFRVDDTVIFKVELTVYGDLESSPILDHDKSFPNITTLETSIRNLFNDPSTADIIIKCGSHQERLHAHRCILSARSEVFRAMFTTSCIESISGEVLIPDIDYNIMKEVIFHVYTDSMPEKTFLAENALPLLLSAIKYQLHYLQESIESQLVSHLMPETAISLLTFANHIDCITLKRKVLLYLAQNANRILQLKEFRELDGSLSSEANAMIDYLNKKRGCRGAADKERKVSFGCAIM